VVAGAIAFTFRVDGTAPTGMRSISTTLLKLSCPDRVGLLSSLSGWVAQKGGNLLEVHQFTDLETSWFFTRMAIETETLSMTLPAFREAFAPLATQLEADWTIRAAESRMKVVIMVSKLGHCLADLLWRWRSGELAFDIPCVISNHEDFRGMVEREGIEFQHIPVAEGKKTAAFAETAALLRTVEPDLVILACYMQIVPPDLCAEFYAKIMNIHHFPAVICRWESLPACTRTRREVDRSDLPLCNRGTRLWADYRPGSDPGRPFPHARRPGTNWPRL
jgi:formyltetrahydrofolate hydrolase